MTGVITLTTDFGTGDGYVGAMHGVLVSRAPTVRVIDITHAIRPQDIQAGGLALARAWPWYPVGSVHCAVIDPGVGSARRGLIAGCAEQVFVLPDNGLLGLALGDRDADWIRSITHGEWCLSTQSATFHGRDVFAPVAAALATGISPERIGPLIDDPVVLSLPHVTVGQGGALAVPIVACDRFGNLITAWRGSACEVRFGATTARVVATYADGNPGELVALRGSDGYWELACVNRSAADVTGLQVGDQIEVLSESS